MPLNLKIIRQVTHMLCAISVTCILFSNLLAGSCMNVPFPQIGDSRCIVILVLFLHVKYCFSPLTVQEYQEAHRTATAGASLDSNRWLSTNQNNLFCLPNLYICNILLPQFHISYN